MEAAIEDTMATAHTSLPRLKKYREIYPSKEMEFCVAEVYTEIMHFLRDSVKYYQRSGLCIIPLTVLPVTFQLTNFQHGYGAQSAALLRSTSSPILGSGARLPKSKRN